MAAEPNHNLNSKPVTAQDYRAQGQLQINNANNLYPVNEKTRIKSPRHIACLERAKTYFGIAKALEAIG